MSFLTVAGIDLSVLQTGASQRSADQAVGKSSRSFSGRLRTTVRWRPRTWAFSLAPMLPADYAALEAAVGTGQVVACSGDALGAAVNCEVTITEAPFTPDGTGFKRQASITLTEA